MSVPAGTYRLGPEDGRVSLRTYRAGAAAKVGHDLLIEVTRWAAELSVPEPDLARARLDVRLDVRSLVVREGTGGAMALSARDRREIEATAARLLAADRFPDASFESTAITATGAGGVVDGMFTVHGRGRPLRLLVSDVSGGGSRRFRATGTVQQSQHGVRPYSAFFGALKLRDGVDVQVDVELPPP